jgi:hypothetical protein
MYNPLYNPLREDSATHLLNKPVDEGTVTSNQCLGNISLSRLSAEQQWEVAGMQEI